MPRKKTEHTPVYQHGVTAGWNDKSQRWTDKAGRITTRQKAIEENVNSDFSGGGTIPLWYNTPITNAFGKFEVMSSNLASQDNGTPYAGLGNILNAALQLSSDPEKKRPANYMLPQVQSRLRLSEHFYQTEGDCSNVCDVPIELIARRLIVDCSDTALREDIEEFLRCNLTSNVSVAPNSLQLFSVFCPPSLSLQ